MVDWLARRVRRSHVVVVGAMALAALAGAVTPASAADDSDESVSASGTTITAKYTTPGEGKMIYAGGLEFDANQAGNVASFSCEGVGTPKENGGPNNSDECLYNPPVASATVKFTGVADWPKTFTVTPFYSYDGRTYVTGKPITVTATPSPIQITSHTGVSCGDKKFRLLFWPQGHGEVASVGFGSFPIPHLELYQGTGGEYPDAQFKAFLDNKGDAGASGVCKTATPKATKAATSPTTTSDPVVLTCSAKKVPLVDVTPAPGGTSTFVVAVGKQQVVAASFGGTGATLDYDKKICKAGAVPT
jgi:hypothetical protein